MGWGGWRGRGQGLGCRDYCAALGFKAYWALDVLGFIGLSFRV